MKKDKTGWAAAFFIIMYLSSAGAYIVKGIKRDEAYGYGLFDTLISSLIMMAIPFLAKIINKGKLPLKKGKRICLINSILLFIISLALFVFFGIGFVGGLGAIMFYFMNKWLFVDLDGEQDNVIKNDKSKHGKFANNNEQTKKEGKDKKNKNEELVVCSNCGNIVGALDERCNKCGEFFNSSPNKKHGEVAATKTNSNIDKKYSDLKKLKELLDDKIITEKEFEDEKKKIINSE